MVHGGADLHKRISQIAVLTAEGGLTQQRIANTPDRVHRFFTQLPSPAGVAIEASGTWWWLADLLEGLGHQPVLSHPKHTKAIAAARLTNDRVDAARLAHLLRGNLLPEGLDPPGSGARSAGAPSTPGRAGQGPHPHQASRVRAAGPAQLHPTSATRWCTCPGPHGLCELGVLRFQFLETRPYEARPILGHVSPPLRR
jgi:hypothetical protein